MKLRGNWIFKALLWIKKLFKSINFDPAKHALFSNVNHRWNEFVWKISVGIQSRDQKPYFQKS